MTPQDTCTQGGNWLQHLPGAPIAPTHIQDMDTQDLGSVDAVLSLCQPWGDTGEESHHTTSQNTQDTLGGTDHLLVEDDDTTNAASSSS